MFASEYLICGGDDFAGCLRMIRGDARDGGSCERSKVGGATQVFSLGESSVESRSELFG
jgi:hypothetical protein